MKRISMSLVISMGFLTAAGVLAAAPKDAATKVINLLVTDNGFEPSSIDVAKGEAVTLHVTRKTDATCATQIQVPSLKVKKDLPLNKEVSIELGKLAAGEIRFGCGMGMMVGGIIHAH